MDTIRNNWTQTIVTEPKENPNHYRFWFGQLGTARGQDRYQIEAANAREAWQGLSEKLKAEGHPMAFDLCQPCEGRGFLALSRDDCTECGCKGWKAA